MPVHSRPVADASLLGARLDALAAKIDIGMISPDPLELVHRYREPRDQEVAGLLAAAFAYGRADIVVRNVGAVLEKMGSSPNAYLESFDPRAAGRRFRGFAHRFHKTPDLIALLSRMAWAIREHGSLGELFRAGYRADDEDIGDSLQRFVSALIAAGDSLPVATRLRRASLAYLLTSPADGSACKRMNLYLRWMVRRESPDLGLWDFVDPAKLVMPVDTHIHRISTFLGLSERKSADWIAARAITTKLAAFNAADPVKYDFALCRLGILDMCSRKRRKENCDVCLLRDVCRFPVE